MISANHSWLMGVSAKSDMNSFMMKMPNSSLGLAAAAACCTMASKASSVRLSSQWF